MRLGRRTHAGRPPLGAGTLGCVRWHVYALRRGGCCKWFGAHHMCPLPHWGNTLPTRLGGHRRRAGLWRHQRQAGAKHGKVIHSLPDRERVRRRGGGCTRRLEKADPSGDKTDAHPPTHRRSIRRSLLQPAPACMHRGGRSSKQARRLCTGARRHCTRRRLP